MSDYYPPHPPHPPHPPQQARTRRRRPPDAPPDPNAYAPAPGPQEWRGVPQARAVQQPAPEPWVQWERTPMRGAQAPAYPAAQGGWHEPAQHQPAQHQPAQRPATAARKQHVRHTGGPKGRKPKRKSRLLPFVMMTLFVAALCLGSVVFVIYRDVSRHEDTFYDGVYVAGVHLGGMTPDEAVQTMMELEQQQVSQWRAALRYGNDVKTMTASDIDLRLDLASLLNDAWNQGRYGNMLERWRQATALRSNPYQKNSDGIHYSQEKLDEILLEMQSGFAREATGATVAFNAEVTGGFDFGREEYGQYLDIGPIRAQIVDSLLTLTSVNILLEPQKIAPEVTVADLQQNNSLIVSVSTPIDRHSAESRNHNVRRASELLDNFRLDPGKRLSFNTVVGKRTLKNGFREALEIAYGEYVMGVGGGVCQVSTTLYQAALRAGLKIETRTVHAIPSTYAEKGQDATVRDDKIDLVIRNTGDTPVHITARYEETRNGKFCIVEIYGRPLPDGIRYTLESRQVGTDLPPDPPVRYVRDTKQEHVKYVGQEKEVTKARVGYRIETYLVKKTSNGMEIGRELISTDIYRPLSAVVYQGTIHRGSD